MPSFSLQNQKQKIGKVMEHFWKNAILPYVFFFKILRELRGLQTPLSALNL